MPDESVDTLTPPLTDLRVAPETTSALPRLVFRPPESASPEISQRVGLYQNVANSLDVLGRWAHHRQAHPFTPDDTSSLQNETALLNRVLDTQRAIKIVDLPGALPDPEDPTQKIKLENLVRVLGHPPPADVSQTLSRLRSRLDSVTSELSAVCPPPPAASPVLEIDLGSDPSAVNLLPRKLDSVIHGLGIPVTSLAAVADISRHRHLTLSEADGIAAPLHRLSSQLDRARSVFTDNFPIEEVGISDVTKVFRNAFTGLGAKGIKFSVQNELPPEIAAVSGFEPLLADWADNLAQNAGRLRQKQLSAGPLSRRLPLTTSLRLYQDNSGRVALEYSDNGPGFDPQSEIITSGTFTPGYTTWGEGNGLSTFQRLIKEYYPGSDLVPSNIVDESGTVRGARLTLSLPAA